MNQDRTSNRLSVLELSRALENISEANKHCHGIPDQFFEYKQRYQRSGIDALKDIHINRKAHPRATSGQLAATILRLSLEHPSWGCVKLSDALKSQGTSISSPTIQSILIKHGMGNKYERLKKLEETAAAETVVLTPEQISFIEKANPCFQERNCRSGRPGELLAQDTIYLSYLEGSGKIYLQVVVDTYGNYAFGFLHAGKLPDCAVAILHNDVLPFYKEKGLTVATILTDNGREYCGNKNHHYELYLMLNDIEHRKTAIHRTRANGFTNRFSQVCINEFFQKAFTEKPYQNIESLQVDFDQWLIYYNTRRLNHGYPNMGLRPIEYMP